MYPAVEITLPLDHVCAAQRSSRAASGYAFRNLDRGHEPAPLTANLGV
jgi:hypothetical protein